MDSLLRTRGTGVSSDVETTIVPQFLSELDGVESLDNVMVIGASNRVDMIDPAVLRPGRLDVKIRVDRPGADQAASIIRHYLTDDLPCSPDWTPTACRAFWCATSTRARRDGTCATRATTRGNGRPSSSPTSRPVPCSRTSSTAPRRRR